MRDFNSLYHTLIRPILTSVVSDTYIGGYFEINYDGDFIDRVKRITGLPIRISTNRLNHNFPQLQNVSISAERLNFKINAGSTELGTESGRVTTNLKAKGEFLERVSASMPIDSLKKNDFDVIKTAEQISPYLYTKKLFSFGYKRVPSWEVYFMLARNNKKINQNELKYQPTTSGCAGHFEYKRAVLGALLELLQRDAFLMYWMNTISPKKIDVDSFINKKLDKVDNFKDLQKIVSDFKKYNLEYYFLDITTDIEVPAVCCVLVSHSKDGKKISVGASAGFSTVSNLISSATEATSVFNSNYFKEVYHLDENYKPFSDNKIGRSERLRLYMNNKNYEHFKFFVSNKESINVEDWANAGGVLCIADLENDSSKQLQYLKGIFNKRKEDNPDYEVLVYEIKNKLLSYFDYKVVRVLCAGLAHLHLNENLAESKHPRLKEFVKHKKLESVARLNIWPHPFP